VNWIEIEGRKSGGPTRNNVLMMDWDKTKRNLVEDGRIQRQNLL